MSAEEELFALLSNAAGVTAIVSDGIYPDEIPLGADIPAIAFQRAATEFLNTLHGGSAVGATVTLEITCVSTSRAAANALANAVVASLNDTEFYGIDQQSAIDQPNELWGAIVNVNFNE